MMIRVLLLCIPLLLIGRVSASGDSVSQILNTTFERKVGDTVTLPCLVQMNITHERVEWFKGPKTSKNDQPIHKCIWRPKATQTQRYDFKNLTSLFEEELSSGNFSLSLKLNTSHNGTYYCYVGGRLYCIVTIKVLPAEEEDTSQNLQNVPESPDNPNNGTDGQNKIIGGVVGGVLGVVALIIIIALAYRHREQLKNICLRRNSNNPEPHRSASYQAQRPPQNQENGPANQNPNEEQRQMLGNEDQGDTADGNEPAADN